MKIYEIGYFERQVLKDEVGKLIIDPVLKEKDYAEIEISKRSGGTRILSCINPDSWLYQCQRRLKDNFFEKIPVSDLCYGYKKGTSYRDFLVPHIGAKYFIRIDIKEFFDSITEELLSEVLKAYIKELPVTAGYTLLDLIVDAVTYKGKLPQGGVTSPILSNIVFRQLDIRIYKYCAKYRINYSRYVDDLLFSANNSIPHKLFFIKGISKILASKGFYVNRNKIIKSTEQISLSGFVVGSELRISRKKRQLLSTILYCFDKHKPKTYNELLTHVKAIIGSINNPLYLHNFLSGYRSFLIGWLPHDSLGYLPSGGLTDFDRKNLRLITQIENILNKLNP
jgi:retron-type reverse transcriptase